MAESATRTRERWLLPITEACAGLGVGRSSLYLLAKRGDIEIVHVGSRALVPAASIDAFVANLRADQGSGALVGETGEYEQPTKPDRSMISTSGADSSAESGEAFASSPRPAA